MFGIVAQSKRRETSRFSSLAAPSSCQRTNVATANATSAAAAKKIRTPVKPSKIRSPVDRPISAMPTSRLGHSL